MGSFNITQLGDHPDKVGKDTNFRRLTISHNVVYLTKGSGQNGVNTLYFIDSTGHACLTGIVTARRRLAVYVGTEPAESAFPVARVVSRHALVAMLVVASRAGQELLRVDVLDVRQDWSAVAPRSVVARRPLWLITTSLPINRYSKRLGA